MAAAFFLNLMQATKWFVLRGAELLLTSDQTIPFSTTPPISIEGLVTMSLPSMDGILCMAVRTDVLQTFVEGFQFTGLRICFDLLPRFDYQMAVKASELLYWDGQTRFCGVCGTGMRLETDISKRCPSCNNEIWPAVSPAVLGLVYRRSAEGVRDNDEVLLIRGRNFPAYFFGLVAGFVETGESLEAALRREVFEETGLRIKNLRYRASQPWPFPSVLMVGFFAEYDGGELKLQTEELYEGGWFKRNALPTLPGNISLSRQLIDLWMAE